MNQRKWKFPGTVSLKSRLVVLMTSTSVILIMLFISYTFLIVDGQIKERIRDQLDKSITVTSFILEEQLIRLKSLGEEIKEDEILETVLTLGLTSKLLLYKENIKKKSNVSFVFFTDMHGRSINWNSTFLSFDMKTDQPFIERALLGLSTTGYSVINVGELWNSDPYASLKFYEKRQERDLLVMMTATPLTDIKGNINAIFVAGIILDMDISLMHKVKNLSGADWTIIKNHRFIAGSVIRPMGDMAYDSPVVEVGDDGILLKEGGHYHKTGIDLFNYQHDVLGQVIVLISDKPFQALQKRLYYIAFLVLLAGLGLSTAIAFFFSDRVIRPLKILGGFTYRIAEEESYEEIPVRRMDEIGQLTHDFNRMAVKLAEKRQALDETNRHLVRIAHQTGMAEVAESVLHHIGNTINPVSVRIVRLNEKIGHRESQILEKVYTIMRSEEIIPETSDVQKTRKENLLKLISTTTDLLNNRNQILKEELNFVQNGMNRIIEIISLQQKYAGLQEIDTWMDLNSLLKDATDILGNSFEKRGIILVFHTNRLPEIPVEKNRMMHVFINIFKNAYESIKAAPPENEKTINIYTSLEKEGNKKWIKVVIADTGSGLLPEDIDKVFRLNYSTKTANYIKALNGSAELFSKGPGKGACFSIRLPVPDATVQNRYDKKQG